MGPCSRSDDLAVDQVPSVGRLTARIALATTTILSFRGSSRDTELDCLESKRQRGISLHAASTGRERGEWVTEQGARPGGRTLGAEGTGKPLDRPQLPRWVWVSSLDRLRDGAGCEIGAREAEHRFRGRADHLNQLAATYVSHGHRCRCAFDQAHLVAREHMVRDGRLAG